MHCNINMLNQFYSLWCMHVMYVCTYVCIHVRMYVCMYVCMYICICSPFSPQSMSWEIQYSPYRSRPSSRLSDIDQHANGLPHMRQLEFTPHSSARRRRDESGVRDEGRKKSEENIRDTSQREPTPVSALFSGHGFELAGEVIQKTELQKTSSLDVPAPRQSLSASGPSSLSVPMVHKSQGGKLQIYVDVPDNASLNYYQRESMRVIPDSHMMVAIEADNPPEEGWEVVHSRNRNNCHHHVRTLWW